LIIPQLLGDEFVDQAIRASVLKKGSADLHHCRIFVFGEVPLKSCDGGQMVVEIKESVCWSPRSK
jgi:hypothetical protein